MATGKAQGADIQLEILRDDGAICDVGKNETDSTNMNDGSRAGDVSVQQQHDVDDELNDGSRASDARVRQQNGANEHFAASANLDLDNIQVTVTTKADDRLDDARNEKQPSPANATRQTVTPDQAQSVAEPQRDPSNAIPIAITTGAAVDSHQYDNPAYEPDLTSMSPETAAVDAVVIERPSEQHAASTRDVHVEAAVVVLNQPEPVASTTSNSNEQPALATQHVPTTTTTTKLLVARSQNKHKVSKIWYRELQEHVTIVNGHVNQSLGTDLHQHEAAIASDSHVYDSLEAAGPDPHDTTEQLLEHDDSTPLLTTAAAAADAAKTRERQQQAEELHLLIDSLQSLANDWDSTLPDKVDSATNTELLDEQRPQVSFWAFFVCLFWLKHHSSTNFNFDTYIPTYLFLVYTLVRITIMSRLTRFILIVLIVIKFLALVLSDSSPQNGILSRSATYSHIFIII